MIDEYNYPEDFLMDDTFKQYCEGSNKKCILFWEDWIERNPEKFKIVQAAKKLYKLLSGNLKPVDQQLAHLILKLTPEVKVQWYNRRFLSIAASIFILLLCGLLFYYASIPDRSSQFVGKYAAQKGEKKKIILPDGTLVFLNSDSKIEIGNKFNIQDRNIKLTGEAFFDVKHNSNKPFYVHTKDFKITVLGTAFNVKSYNGENESAAALIRGTIKLEDNTRLNQNTIIIKAGQKITYHLAKDRLTPSPIPTVLVDQTPTIEVNSLTSIDNQIVESAWTDDNLIFINDNFEDIKSRLERWFDITIEFKDKEIARYVYTAKFKNEDLLTVLHNLQQVKHFSYKKKGDLIIITK